MKGYVPYPTWKENIRLAAAANQIKPEVFEKYFKRGDAAPVFRSAARFVRFFSDEYVRFTRLLVEACLETAKAKGYTFPEPVGPVNVLKGAPLMIIDRTQLGNVRVFQNIPISDTQPEAVREVTDISYVFTLDDFYNSVAEDLKDDQRKRAWAPLRRGITRIKRNESMPIARALRRFSSVLGNPKVPDDIIRDIAQYIENSAKPMVLEYVDKAEDFVEMYTGGPTSCMVVTNEKKSLWKDILKHKQHPCSFFAYFPRTRGCFVKRGNAIAARTIIYETEKRTWEYGRIYAINTGMQEEFERLLQAAKMKPMNPNSVASSHWRAPGFLTDGRYYTPVPYFDNMPHAKGMGVKFLPESKEFEFKFPWNNDYLKNGFVNIAMNVTKGFIIHDECQATPCAACGKAVSANDRGAARAVNGTVFCGSAHAQNAGYILAYRNDGSRVWVLKSEAVMDNRDPSMWYTNRAAAIACGARPCLSWQRFMELLNIGKLPKWDDTADTLSAHPAAGELDINVYFKDSRDRNQSTIMRVARPKQNTLERAQFDAAYNCMRIETPLQETMLKYIEKATKDWEKLKAAEKKNKTENKKDGERPAAASINPNKHTTAGKPWIKIESAA